MRSPDARSSGVVTGFRVASAGSWAASATHHSIRAIDKRRMEWTRSISSVADRLRLVQGCRRPYDFRRAPLHPVSCQCAAPRPTFPVEAKDYAKAPLALPPPALPAGRGAGVLHAGGARPVGSAIGQSTVHGGANRAAGAVLVPQNALP